MMQSSERNILHEVLVFIASPGDVQGERKAAREIADKVNRNLARPHGFLLEVVGWEDVTPDMAERAQEIINPSVYKCHLFILILYRKFGTPTGKAESGTKEEFDIAQTRKRQSGKEPWIHLYFKNVEQESLEDQGPQLQKVEAFKEERKKDTLYKEFEDTDDFKGKFEQCLYRWLNERIAERWHPGQGDVPLEPLPIDREGIRVSTPIPAISLKDVRQIFARMSRMIQQIDDSIEGWRYFPKQLEVVTELCLSVQDDSKSKNILITGYPGAGKSVFIKRLYERISPKVPTLAIQAEKFLDIDDPETLTTQCGIDGRLSDLVEKAVQLKPVVILVDSLDVLANTRTDLLLKWLRFINTLQQVKNVRIVCVSRTFDAKFTQPLASEQWETKIEIDLPEHDDVTQFLIEHLGVGPDSLSKTVRDFLRIPSHLKLATQIVRGRGSLAGLSTLQALYQTLIEQNQLSAEAKTTLTEIAKLMVNHRTPRLRISEVTHLPGLDELRHTGLISGGDAIEFIHPTMTDYLIAEDLVSQQISLSDFLIDKGQNLFVRPIVRHLITILRDRPYRLIYQLSEVFFTKADSIRTHVKVGILSLMADWSEVEPIEAQWLIRLFHDSEKGKAWQTQFFARQPKACWFPSFKGPLLEPALVSMEDRSTFTQAIQFLEIALPDYPKEVLEMIQPLFHAAEPSQDLEWIFHRLSDAIERIELDEESKAIYTELLITVLERNLEKFPYDQVIYLNRLLKIEPQKAVDLYFEKLHEGIEQGRAFQGQDGIGNYFDRLLPEAMKIMPDYTLGCATNFLDDLFISANEGDEEGLRDRPTYYLYAEKDDYFDEEAFLHWFKEQVLSQARNVSFDIKPLLKRLLDSPWKTMQHIGYLSLLESSGTMRHKLLSKTMEILDDSITYDADQELLHHLIKKGFRLFSKRDQIRIVDLILRLPIESEDDERRKIYGTLSHIPREFRLPLVKQKLSELGEKYGPYEYTPPLRIGPLQWVPSPVSKEELMKMDDEELYDFLVQHRDLKERWDDRTLTSVEGVRGIASELEKLVKDNPSRYLPIILRLADEPENNIYIKYCLGSVDLDLKHVDLVIDIAEKTYKQAVVQLAITRSLAKVTKSCSDSQWRRVEPILLYLTDNAPDPESDRYIESRERGFNNEPVGDGINSTRGVLCESWLHAALRFHDKKIKGALIRLSKDKTITVRATLLYHLPYFLRPLRWNFCFKLFRNLFDVEKSDLMPQVPRFLSSSPQEKLPDVLPLLKEMREQEAEETLIAWAVLLAVYSLRGWLPQGDLERLLLEEDLSEGIKQKTLEVVCRFLDSDQFVEHALDILVKITEHGSPELVSKLGFAFRCLRPRDVERARRFIFSVMGSSYRNKAPFWVLEYLDEALLLKPRVVFEILQRVVNVPNIREDTAQFMTARRSKAPLHIVNFVLECIPKLETEALDLLDQLVELQWSGVEEYLQSAETL